MLNRFTLGLLFVAQVCLLGCDDVSGSLTLQLERPSGFPDLDREAVALPKRAQPLPKPPDDRPGATLELVVPVEFFLR